MDVDIPTHNTDLYTEPNASMRQSASLKESNGSMRFLIRRSSRSGMLQAEDLVAVESPLEIRLGPVGAGDATAVAVTMRTPGNDAQLALGFLYSEGLVERATRIARVDLEHSPDSEVKGDIVTVRGDVDTEKLEALHRNFYMTSSCGICGKASLDAIRMAVCPELPGEGPVIEAAVAQRLPSLMRDGQSLFGETGGIHGAGLFDASGRLLVLREDVGRHNAVDKVVGFGVVERLLPLSNRILQVSGRASFEIVQKALMAGIPVLSAVGAPSSLAVKLARAFGMTLLGFVRQGGFNIYSGAGRIATDHSTIEDLEMNHSDAR